MSEEAFVNYKEKYILTDKKEMKRITNPGIREIACKITVGHTNSRGRTHPVTNKDATVWERE